MEAYEKGKQIEPNVSPVALLKRYDRLRADRTNWDTMWGRVSHIFNAWQD